MNTQNRNSWRHRILAERDRLSPAELVEKSGRITKGLFSVEETMAADVFFIYLHFRSEVQTTDIVRRCLAKGKTVTVPLTLANESRLLAVRITDPQNQLEPGYCTIPEPIQSLVPKSVLDPAKIDVVIVPGSVFDRFGGRLGYGGGYYDRFLDREAANALRIGLAYELQLVDQVPLEPHDQLMDFIVTEKKIYDCRRLRHAPDRRVS